MKKIEKFHEKYRKNFEKIGTINFQKSSITGTEEMKNFMKKKLKKLEP